MVICIYGYILAANLVIGVAVTVRPFPWIKTHESYQLRLVIVTDMVDDFRFREFRMTEF